MELLGIKNSKNTTDGHWVNVTFEADSGPVEVTVNTQTMATIAQELGAIVWEAKKMNREAYALSVPTPLRAQAQPTHNRQGVLVRFEMPNKLESLFGLSVDQAKQLKAQLEKALAGL